MTQQPETLQPLLIRTQRLTYRYPGQSPVLQDIDLQVEKGSIYGFLGPNGSGKTTTLSLLLGLLKRQQGSIELFGQEFDHHRTAILRRVGSLIESPSLYGHLSAKDNLAVYQQVYGASRDRIDTVLAMADLTDTGNKPVKRFSLGMKQRLAIALALLPQPELLVLDEPTNGLDPNGIIELRKLIRKLNKTYGITILVSSHILAEVEKMVSHVGIISKGRLLFQGKLAELHHLQAKDSALLLQTSDNEAAIRLLRQYNPVRTGNHLSLSLAERSEVAAINRLLVENKLDVYLLQPQTNSLEKLFIDLTTSLS